MKPLNRINQIFLGLALAPQKFYSSLGVSIPQLRSILTYKLIMDDRRPKTIQQARIKKNSEKKDSQNNYLGSLIISLLFGFIFLYSFSIGSDGLTKYTFYFSMFLIYLSLNLITDFTSVLIDVRDNYILLPKPVNDITVLISRLLHIFIHLCKTILPISLPGFFYIAFLRSWPEALLFFPLIILTTLFCIFIINSVYILILKLTTPERFKNIISYVQIGFAILVYAAYNLLPRLMRSKEMQDFHIDFKPFWLLVPSYWFASAENQVSAEYSANPWFWLSAILALIIPVLSIYWVIKYLAPSFNQKLSLISGSEGERPKMGKTAPNLIKASWEERISGLLTNKNLERAGFLFTWKMMARSRDFKVRVYPMIGYVVVIIIMTLFTKGGFTLEDFREPFSPKAFQIIVSFYISGMLILGALRQIAYSEKYKAAWIFYSTPFKVPGQWLSGSMKALLIQFFTVYGLAFLIFAYFLCGTWIIPNIILGLINQLMVLYLILLIRDKELPFTKTLLESQKKGQVYRSILTTLLLLIPAGIHYFVFLLPFGQLAMGLISLGILTGLFIQLKNTSWEGMENIQKDF